MMAYAPLSLASPNAPIRDTQTLDSQTPNLQTPNSQTPDLEASHSKVTLERAKVTLERAREYLISGDYALAVEMGAKLETAQGYALAAEALTAQIVLGRFEDLHARAIESVRFADQAVRLAPEDENAHLQYALAFGVMTRTSSVFKAWRKQYPDKSLKIIQAFQTRYPDNPKGDALLGAWHLGVIRKAGEKNALNWYNATLTAGIEAYNSALKSAPQDILITSTFAVSLYVLSPEIYENDARNLLEWVETLSPQTAIEREVKSAMDEILEALSAPDKAVELSERFLDGHPL